MHFTKYFKNKEINDSFQAFLATEAQFTPVEEYPILPAKMIATNPPHKIMPFCKAINSGRDLSDTFICTYEDDSSFKRIQQKPKRYLSFFKRTAGLIGFDYSVLSNMPLVKQKSQMNDNLSLTYYYGSNNIPIIPNVRFGVDELAEDFLLAIPKHSLIAIGVHGFYKHKFEKYEWYCFLEHILPLLQPTGVVVYGNLNDKIFDPFKKCYHFHYYTPWIYTNYHREAKKHGN